MIHITVGKWIVSPYAIFFAMAFVAGISVLCVRLNIFLPANMIQLQVMMSILFPILGGKLYGYALNYKEKTSLITAPMGSIGGVLGFLISALLFGIIYRKNQKDILDCHILVLPLMYGISKMGCFFAGCCAGIEYEGVLNVIYEGDADYILEGPRFPVQLVETIAFLIIFMAGIIVYKVNTMCGAAFIILLCSMAKGTMEQLREEAIGRVISANQIVCLVMAVISTVWLIRYFVVYKNEKKRILDV